jgi:hypothetical protein
MGSELECIQMSKILSNWFDGRNIVHLRTFSPLTQRANIIANFIYDNRRLPDERYEKIFSEKVSDKYQDIVDFLIEKAWIDNKGILTKEGIAKRHVVQYLFYPRSILEKI